MEFVNCQKCDGHYVWRCGTYGYFGGCSNFPKCRSTIKASELILNFIKLNGLNLFAWDKECWKCNNQTKVYSYFLFYELEELHPMFRCCGGMGLGDIGAFDNIVMQKYPTIKNQFSHTTKSNCIANSCQKCGALQGYYHVVTDPHEIWNDLAHNHTMDKYCIENIKADNFDEAFINYLVQEFDKRPEDGEE